MIVRSCFLKYMIDRNCNKLGCIGFSVATTNYIKSYGKQSAVPTMSQVLKSFKEKARYTVSLKIRHGVVPQDCVLMYPTNSNYFNYLASVGTITQSNQRFLNYPI